MKNAILLVALLSFTLVNSQAFKGKGDSYFHVGANFQKNGTGINLSYDYGIGQNISVGLSSTYLLSIDDSLKNNPSPVESLDAGFDDRFDLRVRFNANLGNVINVDENLDVYPGLSLGVKNFGGHLGARYFFSEGFGVFTELNMPLALYNTDDLVPAQELNNQFTINIGATFNL